ncbi:MAG: 4-hydroxy-3-methylbut-2-enyl diphosphate reductase [Gemmatimonadaceae bacterium]|nr:4-hydroxy-3-methylbut-2-enyl diphosphate reductase [Gemmatimonadaceae bacterium]MDQ3520118.1 4-hydroxy-3-methylbut-2-enyl diphosphate reductase [Gemmatimonadota bacterium]
MTPPSPLDATYFRKGFGLKTEVQGTLQADYSGHLVDLLRERDYVLTAGDVTVRLAREFGFCYGVERAVEYAYQARSKFPDRRIILVGEIIHNPHINTKLRAMGVNILEPANGSFDYSVVKPEDVVIIPAFGVTIHDFQMLREIGCVVVDTTCGSVLNVWKRVESYAREGYTALIHGKHYHEETRATASQVHRYPNSHYLVVRDMAEARFVCDFIEGKLDSAALMGQLGRGASPGFDPPTHLRRIGVANQTTMLASESLAIAAEVGKAIERASGSEGRASNFRSFDTICSATQERQDAVQALLAESLDVMVVVGGYNSSNTLSLAAMCAERVTTFHVEDATCIDVERGTIRHKPIGKAGEIEELHWLPDRSPVVVGITAGASTPNNKIGESVARIFATRGVTVWEAGG